MITTSCGRWGRYGGLFVTRRSYWNSPSLFLPRVDSIFAIASRSSALTEVPCSLCASATRSATLSVAEHVAEAHKEHGTAVSQEERNAISKIESSLGVNS